MEKKNTVSISVPSIKDGHVRVQIEKAGCWISAVRQYQKVNTGVTVIPVGELLLNIPLPEDFSGDILTVEALGEVLSHLLETVLPTCQVFIGQVEDDFGFVAPVESEIQEEGGW